MFREALVDDPVLLRQLLSDVVWWAGETLTCRSVVFLVVFLFSWIQQCTLGEGVFIKRSSAVLWK